VGIITLKPETNIDKARSAQEGSLKILEGLGEKREEIYAKVAAALPGKRIGTVEEGAQAILFALANEYLNGEILHLDGGARLI
jgi:NAD(P)-dependent dehydrogenase (short-subunit alcohol dehydrogenase family)